MYERLRNDFAVEVANLEKYTIVEILQALDRVSTKYDITVKETGLSVTTGELPGVVQMYLVCKKMAGLSDTTLRNYKVFLKSFFCEINKPPQSITANDIRLFLYWYQQNRGISARSLDKYREYLSHFFTWAHEEGYIQTNPSKTITAIKHEEKPRESLSQVELEYVRKACDSLKERAIIEFLYSTGCRVSELTNVKKDDINWNDKSVHLFGKGRKHRISFINAKAQIALQEYLNSRSDDCDYLFVSSRKPYRQMHKDGIEKVVRNISDRAFDSTGKRITPHILRHTMATTALHGGMPIADISKLLGHEKIDTTMIYAKSSLTDVQAGHKKYII